MKRHQWRDNQSSRGAEKSMVNGIKWPIDCLVGLVYTVQESSVGIKVSSYKFANNSQ